MRPQTLEHMKKAFIEIQESIKIAMMQYHEQDVAIIQNAKREYLNHQSVINMLIINNYNSGN